MAGHLAEIDFGRAICGDSMAAARREWLVTNGIGGFACGTISGELTRRYHGLLVAALQPPLGRTLLVTKFDESLEYLGEQFALSTNRYSSGQIEPYGYQNIERFYLDGTTPVWEFACADAVLEKRIWMEQGANTTYVHYTLLRGAAAIRLDMKILANYRDYHGQTTLGWKMQVKEIGNGVRISSPGRQTTYYVLCRQGRFQPRHAWLSGYALSVEQYRGLDGLEDHLYCADFLAELKPGESLTLAACLEPATDLDGSAAWQRQCQHSSDLLSTLGQQSIADKPVVERLALAADQFIVSRSLDEGTSGHSVIAGYPWFGDWGRDTMISLPGLALCTGRPQIARSILRTFASFVDRGMLPNRWPDQGEQPEYNTVDATLWYFEAIRAYVDWMDRSGSPEDGNSLLVEIFPVLREIIDWHVRGTRYRIGVDKQDGLVYAGEPGVQLTWMDAKVAGWVVTPRIGKPVEINALWYNALCCMQDFARRLGEKDGHYQTIAEGVGASFGRFWNDQAGYCYDVIDGPEGNDASLRPNQLFAVALPYSPLHAEQAQSVVDACARYLLTSHGLRSLAAFEIDYQGHYGGSLRQRDAAYHQGTVWSWLIGPFVRAHLRVYDNRRLARSYLLPLIHHLSDHGLGSVSEIFDGDAPFTPRGCFAQAWGVAELLRAWIETQE